jgi:hypothetical protein
MDLFTRRGARLGISLLALGVMAPALSTALSATASAEVTTAGSLLQTTTNAIAQQRSAHVVFVAHSDSPSTTEKIVADVGVTTGSETLSEGKADLSIRLTATYGYVRGSRTGLTTLFGLPDAQAKVLGTRWEAWKSGTRQYANLKGDLTMSSIGSLLPKPKGTNLSTKDPHGANVYLLTWTTAATKSTPKLSNRLTISAAGTSLPIEETRTTTTGVKVKTQLSRWGEDVTVLAPPAARIVVSSKITG